MMHVNMYNIYTYMRMYASYTYIRVYIYTYAHIYVYIHIYIHTYIYMCISIHTWLQSSRECLLKAAKQLNKSKQAVATQYSRVIVHNLSPSNKLAGPEIAVVVISTFGYLYSQYTEPSTQSSFGIYTIYT